MKRVWSSLTHAWPFGACPPAESHALFSERIFIRSSLVCIKLFLFSCLLAPTSLCQHLESAAIRLINALNIHLVLTKSNQTPCLCSSTSTAAKASSGCGAVETWEAGRWKRWFLQECWRVWQRAPAGHVHRGKRQCHLHRNKTKCQNSWGDLSAECELFCFLLCWFFDCFHELYKLVKCR